MKSSRKYRMESTYFYLDITFFFNTLLSESLCPPSSFTYQTSPFGQPTILSNMNKSNDVAGQKWLNIVITCDSALITGISQLHHRSNFLASLPSSVPSCNTYWRIILIPFFIYYSPAQTLRWCPTAKQSPTLNSITSQHYSPPNRAGLLSEL